MRCINAQIYFPETQVGTTVWVADNATEDDIRQAVFDEALSMIEIEYYEEP